MQLGAWHRKVWSSTHSIRMPRQVLSCRLKGNCFNLCDTFLCGQKEEGGEEKADKQTNKCWPVEIFLVLCKGPLTFLFNSLKTVLALQVPAMLCSHRHSPAMEVMQCPRDCSLQGASPPLPLLGVPTTAQLSRGLDIHFCDGFFFFSCNLV